MKLSLLLAELDDIGLLSLHEFPLHHNVHTARCRGSADLPSNFCEDRPETPLKTNMESYKMRYPHYKRILLLCIIAIILFVCAFVLQNPQHIWVLWTEPALWSVAKGISQSNGFVFLMFLNNAYLEMTKSWICKAQAIIPDVLKYTVFITTSDELSLELQTWNKDAQTFVQKYSVTKPVSYGTYEYFRLTEERLRVQNNLIQQGVNVFVIESDAVWNSKEIIDVIHSRLQSNIIVTADDGNGQISAGFIGIRSTNDTRSFFQKSLDSYSATLANYKGRSGHIGHVKEQKTITQTLNALHITIHRLTHCESANGQWYGRKPDPKCPLPMVIQNNWIVGNANKIKRSKKWGHWYLNDEGLCRS